MAVYIIWSLTNGGIAISDTIDHGSAANGSETTEKEFFVRHNGNNSITNVGLYIRQFSGTYTGSFTASTDIAEVLSWGDGNTLSDFGGFMVNQNAITSYATGWPTYDSKSPSGGFVHRTGVGDSEGNAVDIATTTGASVAGEIQAGSSPNVRFKTKVAVPSNEATIGVRQWETVLRYSYTS